MVAEVELSLFKGFGLSAEALADDAEFELYVVCRENLQGVEEIFWIFVVLPAGGPEDSDRAGLSFRACREIVYAGWMDGRFFPYFFDGM